MNGGHADVDRLRDELLRQRLLGTRTGRRARVQRVSRDRPLPLSFGQQQMWFLNRMAPDSPEYLVPLTLRLRGPLEAAAVARAVDQIVERHEILRTRYTLTGTEPVQVIGRRRPAVLVVTDLRELPERDRERQATRLAGRGWARGHGPRPRVAAAGAPRPDRRR